MQKNGRSVFQWLLAFFIFASASAFAQPGFGIRAGVTADPNQFHFGGHFVSESLIKELTFRPNLEIGIGSSLTAVTANFEFAYHIPVPKTEVSAYFGAGPALAIYKFSASRNRSVDTGGGFNILIGMEHRSRLFGELKVGALDSPELKFTVGYTFR